ncbi:hypothetical protein BDZ89DRAFT_1185838, partial [Hymenopellis radicata]
MRCCCLRSACIVLEGRSQQGFKAVYSYHEIQSFRILSSRSTARISRVDYSYIIRKTGIHPYNPDILPPSAFGPSLNTTTEAAQPIPAQLPPILIPALSSQSNPTPAPPNNLSSASHQSSTPAGLESSPTPSTASPTPSAASTVASSTALTHVIRGLSDLLGANASRRQLAADNKVLRGLLEEANRQLLQDHAQMILMDLENRRLRSLAFAKKNKPMKKETNAYARHLTAEENLQILSEADVKAKMKTVFGEAALKFKERRQQIADSAKAQVLAAKDLEKQVEKLRKEAEKAMKDAQKLVEKQAKDAARAEEKRKRDEVAAAKKEAAAAKREAAAAKREAAAAKKAARKGGGKKRMAARSPSPDDMLDGTNEDDDYSLEIQSPHMTPRVVRRLQMAERHTERQTLEAMLASGEAEEITGTPRPRPRPKPRPL